MQPGKNIKILINYFVGPALFIWLSFSIYRQVMHQDKLEQSWWQIRQSFQSYKIFYLVAAFLLIGVNWGLEAWKWKLSMKTVHPISFLQAYKGVLSGISFSVTMPNRIGEYIGRMMYLPEGSRLKTISVSLVGSFAQLLVTLVAGTAGLILMKELLLSHFVNFRIWSQFVIYGLVIVVILLLVLYFNVNAGLLFFRKWIRNQKYVYLVEALENFSKELLGKILVISFLRYCIFLLQYLLVFYLFEVNVSVGSVIMVMTVVFLAMAIIPSITLVEVWLRGEVIILLMGLFSRNTLGIGFTSVTVWFMNLIFPAIIGSLLLLNLRVFKKRNETG